MFSKPNAFICLWRKLVQWFSFVPLHCAFTLKSVIAALQILQHCAEKPHFLPLPQFLLNNVICIFSKFTVYLLLVQMIWGLQICKLLQCLNKVLQGQIDFQDSTSQWVSIFIYSILAISCLFIILGSVILSPALELNFPVIRECWVKFSLV